MRLKLYRILKLTNLLRILPKNLHKMKIRMFFLQQAKTPKINLCAREITISKDCQLLSETPYQDLLASGWLQSQFKSYLKWIPALLQFTFHCFNRHKIHRLVLIISRSQINWNCQYLLVIDAVRATKSICRSSLLTWLVQLLLLR